MKRFNIKKRIKSFGYAYKGIISYITNEHNAWIHLGISVFVILAGLFFHLTKAEWIIVIFCIGFVLTAEAFNTAIERLVNIVSPEHNPSAGNVKDIAAGAVLISAITAAIIGLIIFIPYLIRLF
ncbi:MAG: diacylglycerol kinase family protein [Bacteroidaceae bacterium]|nr:diacylglycerol kinase family protein [Bacteroidaceae bacterium]